MTEIFLIIFALIFVNFSTASAQWTLPEKGLQLHGEEKQNFIKNRIDIFFGRAQGEVPPRNFEIPDGWIYEKFQLDGVNCEMLENPNAETDRVVIQFHGGGYILPLTDINRYIATRQLMLARAKKIFLLDNRLAPENIFPAARDDAFNLYKEILRRGINPEKIIIVGDSAGGNLALALCLFLKEKNLPQPKMLILISAWGTVENNLPSRKFNFERDALLGKNNFDFYLGVKNSAYAKNLNKKNPQLSPIYADLKNLPQMLIQAGGYEIFLSDCIELAKKAAADNVKVTLTIYPEMPHDFAMDFEDLQESIDSWREIKNFIDQNF